MLIFRKGELGRNAWNEVTWLQRTPENARDEILCNTAWESCTGAWLVHPAAGCEKKIGGLHNEASDHQIEYTRTYFTSLYK